MTTRTKKIIFFLILFILGIALNLYSVYLHYITDFFANTPSTLTTTLYWLISVIIFSLSIIIIPFVKPPEKIEHDSLSRYEKAFLVLILFFALALRLYRLNTLPIFLAERYWLDNAIGILDGRITTPFGYVGDFPTNIPTHLIAYFLILFKNAYTAVRLPGVAFSILNILFVFLFLKEAINKKTAFFSAILLSTSIWDIHTSQLGFQNMSMSPFLISGTCFFLYRSLKYFSPKDILLTGIFLGTSINSLWIATLSLIIVFIYFIYQLISNKNRNKIFYLLLILLITTFVVTSPTAIKIYKYPNISIGRHKSMTLENINYSKNQGGLIYYLDQFKLRLNDFSYQENKYDIYQIWGVTLEPIVIFFFIVGLSYSFIHLLSSPYIILLSGFLLMFTPVVIIYHAGSWYREIGLLPTIYIFSAIGMAFIHRITTKLMAISSFLNKRTNLNQSVFLLIIFIYLISWIRYYYLFQNRYLQNRIDVYENYCKRTADYIEQNVPQNRLILRPQELCEDLISIALLNKYRYGSYNSYQELESYLKTTKEIVIIKMGNTDKISDFHKLNPIPVFEENLKKLEPSLKSNSVRDENNNIYSIVYTL